MGFGILIVTKGICPIIDHGDRNYYQRESVEILYYNILIHIVGVDHLKES